MLAAADSTLAIAVVAWSLPLLALAFVLWRAVTRPVDDTDRACARIDAELDAEYRTRGGGWRA